MTTGCASEYQSCDSWSEYEDDVREVPACSLKVGPSIRTDWDVRGLEGTIRRLKQLENATLAIV